MSTLYGYRDLDFIKSRLLPADMGDDSDYDADLMEIGKGVAAAFDTFTGRKLKREVGAVHECAADVDSVVLTSYPVEAITAVAISYFGIDTPLTDAVVGQVKKAGIVHFSGAPGNSEETLRITSTGGFWCDDGNAMPVGATPIPDDLILAWIQQCRAVCEAEDTFRTKGAGKDSKKTGLDIASLELLPGVIKTLHRYMRFP